MATYTTTITPRLRVTRYSAGSSERSLSQIASGPSRLPDFSQLVDVTLNDMPVSESSDPRQTASRSSTPSTVTRSENPAEKLRALLSRLPPASPPAQRRPLSPQDPSERESDYDMSESSHATRSVAQESLKDLFSKARREPNSTPQKSRPRRNSVDNSEVDASPANNRSRTDRKGKRRSLSDDEVEQNNDSPPRRLSRSRATPTPVTMEFLKERFDISQSSPARSASPSSNHDSSNETATILLNLSSSPPSPPMATSTPQQSLSISVNERFQSNLLDDDTDMQNAIEGLESYADRSLGHPTSPPPVLKKRSKTPIDQDFRPAETPRHASRHSPSQLSLKSARATPKHEGTDEPMELSDEGSDWDTPHPGQRTSKHMESRIETSHSHSSIKLLREEARLSPNDKLHTPHRPPHSSHSSASPLSNANDSRQRATHARPVSPSGFAVDHDDEASEVMHERERNWNSPHPVWHNPQRSLSPLPKPAGSGRQRADSLTATPRVQEENHTFTKQKSSPSMKSIDVESGKHRSSQHVEPPERTSPTPRRSSTPHPPGSTCRDGSSQHNERSPPPFPSSKKRPGSPSTSATSRKHKTSATNLREVESMDPSLSIEGKEALSAEHPFSVRERSNSSSMDLTSIHYAGSSSKNLSHAQWSHSTPARPASFSANGDDHGAITDDLRDTDFSSQGNPSPPLTPVSPPRHELSNGGHSYRSISSRHDSQISPPVSSTPMKPIESATPSRQTLGDFTGSPSTPIRRNTSRSSKMEFQTPSPPKDLPDLPSLSDDELERDAQMTPAMDMPRTFQGMPTPKPPGGWYATPKPPQGAHLEQSDDFLQQASDSWGDLGNGRQNPATPLNRFETPGAVGKTPKPPGGWVVTPGPSSLRPSETDTPEASPGLLTPVASLSKGSSFDPKTPGVPGGWLNTPAPKKSILKVRFDSEASRDERQVIDDGNTDTTRPDRRPTFQSWDPSFEEGSSSALPASPRSPSKAKGPGIRVLDAFGREEESSEVKDNSRSRSMLRVVDAMGREVDDSHNPSVDDVKLDELTSSKLSRGELLSRIRRGLDDLADEFDGLESDKEVHSTKARIEELKAVSRQARKARERLQRKGQPINGMQLLRTVSSSNYSLRDRWRFYVVLTFVHLLFLLFIYRLALSLTRRQFLNTYYDPFNPEVHIYLFSSGSPRLFTDPESSKPWIHRITQVRTWRSLLHLAKDIPSYLWNLWDDNSVSRNSVWIPT